MPFIFKLFEVCKINASHINRSVKYTIKLATIVNNLLSTNSKCLRLELAYLHRGKHLLSVLYEQETLRMSHISIVQSWCNTCIEKTDVVQYLRGSGATPACLFTYEHYKTYVERCRECSYWE